RKRRVKRTLDAYSIAAAREPERLKVRQHRLGETDDDGPRRKRQRVDEDDDDEYEADDSKHRRPQRRSSEKGRFNELDITEGSDSEGNAWRMGHVGDEDDSDVDSDEAFGESDEERFEGFTFRGSSSHKKSRKDLGRSGSAGAEDDSIKLNESDADEGGEDKSEGEDSLGDEAVDLATMLDNYDEEAEEEAPESDSDEKHDNWETDSGNSVSQNGDDSDPRRLLRLQSLISSLQPDSSKGSKPRPVDTTESKAPSDFGLTASQKLKVEDLLPTIKDSRLRKSIRMLAKSRKDRKRDDVLGKLEAPLPKRQQDRLDRIAANEKAKETLDRWVDTVKHNRRAEHLSFPMQDPSVSKPPGSTRFVPLGQPANDLEREMQKILQESGISNEQGRSEEDQVREFEELQLNKVPLEVVQARRAELRKQRELLFREETRAKRIKKIKSKTYRRVHRKERERAAQQERSAMIAAGIDLSEEEREQNDRRRAMERMGAKHRESNWAKGVKKSGRAAWDEDAREGVTEMARRNEELRKRMEGKKVHHDDIYDPINDSSDSSSDEGGAEDQHTTAQRLQRRLQELHSSASSQDKMARLASLKFMQKAEARKKEQNDEDVERLQRELAGEESGSDREGVTVGRKLFGPSSKDSEPITHQNPQLNEFEEKESSEEDEPPDNSMPSEPASTTAPHPRGTQINGSERKRSRTGATHMSGRVISSQQTEHGNINLSIENKPRSKANRPRVEEIAAPFDSEGWTIVTYDDEKDNRTEENDEEDKPNDANPFSSLTEDTIYKVFGGDEVVQEFEKEKKAVAEEEDEQIIDNTLPGWGTWTGEGLSKAQQKRNKGRVLTKQEGVKADRRKDAKLDRVIINEKRVKKNSKYMATGLPHPFESRQQYERHLRLGMGPEWLTKQSFQDATKPRVMVKRGAVIEPLKRPLL
ncbi:Utp14 protein-domain-containing protein, partial [Lineolata rhizophorae]